MNYVVNKPPGSKNYVPESFDTDFINYDEQRLYRSSSRKEKVGESALSMDHIQ